MELNERDKQDIIDDAIETLCKEKKISKEEAQKLINLSKLHLRMVTTPDFIAHLSGGQLLDIVMDDIKLEIVITVPRTMYLLSK